jgi:hypothetical protein
MLEKDILLTWGITWTIQPGVYTWRDFPVAKFPVYVLLRYKLRSRN